MKVACIGNMNNNFFALTRYLRDNGINTTLFLLGNEPDHFHPSADAFDQAYEGYTRYLDWKNPRFFFRKTKREILSVIGDYDFIIGCGATPAFLQKARRRLDIFAPYGSDLYDEPFIKWDSPRSILLTGYVLSQRSGIRNARYINIDTYIHHYADAIRKLGYRGQVLNFTQPMLYLPQYDPAHIPEYLERSMWGRQFLAIRAAHDLVVFHHARHIWKHSPNVVSWKGNDKLVRGFAAFMKKHKGVKGILVMIEYGTDVRETKRLVHALGIDGYVAWFPQMPRKEIMLGISLCDIGTGDFSLGSLLGGVNYEVLAMGKPFMHYCNIESYRDSPIPLYPMMNVCDEVDIENSLLDYLSRPEFYQGMGAEGRLWLQERCIDYPVKEYLRIMREKTPSSCQNR